MPDRNTIKATDKDIYDNVKTGDFYHSSWAAGAMFEYEKKILTHWIHKCPPRSDTVVLEIGCGGGYLMDWLSNFGNMIIGLDHSLKFIKEAAHRNKKNDNYVFLLSDAEVLPLRPDTIDLIMCGSILHHLPDYKNALRELKYCLRQGGILAATEPCAYNPFAILRRKYFPSVFHTPDERPFPPNEIINEFKGVFDVVYYRRSFIFAINASLIERFLGKKVARIYLAISMAIDSVLLHIPLINQLCWRTELVGVKISI